MQHRTEPLYRALSHCVATERRVLNYGRLQNSVGNTEHKIALVLGSDIATEQAITEERCARSGKLEILVHD